MFFIENKGMGAYANRALQHIQVKRQKLDRFPKKSVKTRSFVSPITTTTIVFFSYSSSSQWNFVCVTDFRDIVQTTMIKEDISKFPYSLFNHPQDKKSKLASFITSILSRFSSRQLNFFFKRRSRKLHF